jgi:hypothetical protein
VERLSSAEFRNSLCEQSVSGLVSVSNHCWLSRGLRSATNNSRQKRLNKPTAKILRKRFWLKFLRKMF